MLVIPALPSLKAAQLLASDPAQDRVCEIVDLLFRGEADLRMSFELGAKPSGPAFRCADANKIDEGHLGKSKAAVYVRNSYIAWKNFIKDFRRLLRL